MGKFFNFESAVFKHAADRSRRSAHSSVASMIRALVTAVIVSAVVTGSIVGASWWPVVGGLVVLLSVFLWHVAAAPRRLWADANARIQSLEEKLAYRIDALEKAKWLEGQFKIGEMLLTNKLDGNSFHVDLDEWKGHYESWCTEVALELGKIHDKDRFMFESIGFESRVDGYKSLLPWNKHLSRSEDLTKRLIKLRLITDRMYGLASLPGQRSSQEVHT